MTMLNRLPPDTRKPADQDDHHTIAIDIISGDNHYPARALHPHPFAATIAATPATWVNWFGSTPTVAYTFITDANMLASLLPAQPNYVNKETGLVDVSDHRPLVSTAFHTWATYS